MQQAIKDGRLTISMADGLQTATAADTARALKAGLGSANGVTAVTVDLGAAAAFDTAGMAVLAGLARECAQRNWPLAVTGAGAGARQLIRWYHAEALLGLEET